MRALTITLTLFLFVVLFPQAVRAELEIIPLRHRTVDQVLPVLRPLLEPGGALSGQNNQLIVRTSPRNLEEIRRVLASIDTPQRRLQISVRFDSALEARDRAIDVSGTVRSGDVAISNQPRPAAESNVTLRARDARSNSNERVDQRIQVLEGGHAFISTGESRPIDERVVYVNPQGRSVTRTTAIQEARTGFEVVPRVSGDQVFLEIAQQREAFGAPVSRGGASTVQGERAVTTVSARLGEWFEIGGVGDAATASARGIGSSRDSSRSAERRIWVRVDEVGR